MQGLAVRVLQYITVSAACSALWCIQRKSKPVISTCSPMLRGAWITPCDGIVYYEFGESISELSEPDALDGHSRGVSGVLFRLDAANYIRVIEDSVVFTSGC